MRVIRVLMVALCVWSAAELNGEAQTLSEPQPEPTPGLSQLLTDTVRDFTRLPSMQNGWLFGIAAGTALGLHPADHRASDTMSRSSTVKSVLGPGGPLGGARVQFGSAFAIYLAGRVTHQRTATLIGADLIRAGLLTQGMVGTIKVAARRQRPDGTSFSFPSGHAAASFATATVLQRHLGWKVGVPAYAAAVYVASSRIADKRHFLSDVAFGAGVGLVAGRTATLGSGSRRITLTPQALPGGGGFAVSWR